MRHLDRRAPRAQFGFSWGRVLHPGLGGTAFVEYRLFIRERDSGKLYAEFVKVPNGTPRANLARLIRARRAQLKWVRDRLEFERLGLQDMAPRPGVPA